MTRIRYILGDEAFTSKTAVATRVSNLLRSSRTGAALVGHDLHLVLDLLERHPHKTEKLSGGCKAIIVDSESQYGGRCFWVVRGDGSKVDFSYRKCIFPVTPAQEFSSACRREVADFLLAFKQRQFREGEKCPITGDVMTWDSVDIDHIQPETFAVLVKDFVGEGSIDVRIVVYERAGIGLVFKDRDLAGSWRQYHNSRARLQFVSPYANRVLLPAVRS